MLEQKGYEKQWVPLHPGRRVRTKPCSRVRLGLSSPQRLRLQGVRIMTHRGVLAGSALLLIFTVGSAMAGPCAQDIVRVQALVDARIDAIAGAGPAGSEARGALLHQQPTPGSLATAEQRLGDGRSMDNALAALARARTADDAGNKTACDQALAEAQQAAR